MATDKMSVPESERFAVASALVDPWGADRVCEMVGPEDFADPQLALVFATIHALVRRRERLDVSTVIESVGRHGVQSDFVLDLVQGTVGSSANAGSYARNVQEAAALRRMAVRLQEVSQLARAATAVPGAVQGLVEMVRADLDGLVVRFGMRGPVALGAAEPDLLPRILADTPSPRGILTGYQDVDDILGGLRNGEMVVLASRPSVGKSLFACNIAENIAIKPNGTPVLVISCEMSASSLYRRALFGRAGVDGDEALRGTTTPEEKDALRRAHGEIRRAEISVLADGNMTAQRVHAAARRFKAHHESCVVIVDYLQLLNSDARGAYERATELSKAMKSIAVDLDVPMLVLSQLSRNAAESRDRDGNLVVKRPTLADLRDSGAIEQDADVVLFLSRDITQREPHPCDVDIAKNRPGVTGHTQVQFQPRGPRFVPTTKVEQFTGR